MANEHRTSSHEVPAETSRATLSPKTTWVAPQLEQLLDVQSTAFHPGPSSDGIVSSTFHGGS